MVPAILFMLASVPIENQVLPQPVLPRGVRVSAAVSAEIMRVGRVGGIAGPQDVTAPLRLDRDGRILAEFR